LATRVY